MKNILCSIFCICLLSSCNDYSIIEGISYEEETKVDNRRLISSTLESKSFDNNQIRYTAYFKNPYEIGEVTITYTINGPNQTTVVKKTTKYYPGGLAYCNEFAESSADFTIPSGYLNSPFNISYNAENSAGVYWTGTSGTLYPGQCGAVVLNLN